MASHNELGKDAEELAAGFLVTNGYKILHRNWRYSRFELDIVAEKNDVLRIIEVKALQSPAICYPEEHVTRKKFKHLLKAADEFLFQHKQYRNFQFDIIAITYFISKPPEVFLIEDVFF